MCDRAQSEKEHRAVTADETGEFRLWNIYVKERTSEPTFVPTIQIFTISNSEVPYNRIRFLAIPSMTEYCTSYYSDIIACSSKLMHFLPEKNAKDFQPPTSFIFHESSSCLVTAVGKTLLKYDICTGAFMSAFPTVSASDVTAVAQDGLRGTYVLTF